MQVFTPDGSIVDGEILDHKNGTYEFVYTVPKEGDFSLALRLYDQHIKGSPFKLTVSKASDVEVEVGLIFQCPSSHPELSEFILMFCQGFKFTDMFYAFHFLEPIKASTRPLCLSTIFNQSLE